VLLRGVLIAGGFALGEDAKQTAVVVIGRQAPPLEQYAADELYDYLQKLYGIQAQPTSPTTSVKFRPEWFLPTQQERGGVFPAEPMVAGLGRFSLPSVTSPRLFSAHRLVAWANNWKSGYGFVGLFAEFLIDRLAIVD
jgi:hypothetical protein